MIRQYFKQAWELIRQNKLFSIIYVAGTALAISMVMVIAIFFYLKTGNIYPELERNRLLFVKMAQITPKDTTERSNASAFLSLQTVKNCFYNLQSAEVATATLFTYKENYKVHTLGSTIDKKVYVKYTDANFWKVFQFRFLQGKPFSQEEFDSAIPSVVISESLSQHLFPNGQAIGEYFIMNEKEYHVNGVVKDASYLLSESFAHIWLPYTLHPNHTETFAQEGILGFFSVVILMKNSGDTRRVSEEIHTSLQRYSSNLTHNIDLLGQPDNVLASSFRMGNSPLDINDIFQKFVFVLLIFMLVPAINLSGLNSSRMEKRLAEMGVRKAFGAPNSTLLNHILIENFLLTLIGAFVGLLISYLLITVFSDMLLSGLSILSSDIETVTGSTSGITPGMLINFTVFSQAFVAALIVNTLSAIIPAYRFTKKNITDSLSENYTN
ncbi:MAG: FtsX-like permease family protein [Proteiniphilum sp.]|uniref:ABC transporter permease n=1 Tax=Proteiniphilum sp. TaxID=1926877 RepID=UPI002ABC2AD8|nr:FtsX-like permease family protein [Proteiniphilum sp.]MDY9919584.1 FtsX-like permease family protein [Proteiniphilum sp.]